MEGLTGAHRIAAALEQAGLPAAELPGRLALIADTIAEFHRATGRRPSWAWFVLGRIEVFVKHTDYAGGRSMVAAVPRGFAVVASPRSDAVVTARDARFPAATEVRLDDQAPADVTGWASYVHVVARRLASNFPGAPFGADIVFGSDLPRAAGLSSSSALVVGVATALIRCAELEARPEWRNALHGPLDLAGYLGAVENGLSFGALPSTAGVGTHGGSEDHTAILTCRPGRVSAYAYVPVRPVGDATLPADWQFVVMSSGVSAAKAGAARGRYNRASLATGALVDVWRAHTGNAPATLAQVMSDPDRASALRSAIRAVPHPEFDPDALERRLMHFVAEDGRVPLALTAISNGDEHALGDLSAASQRDAAVLLDNQVPQTIALAELARECGAFAACSFGAGFGGSVWALASGDASADALSRWRARFLDRYPHQDAAGFIARPAPPLTELPLEG